MVITYKPWKNNLDKVLCVVRDKKVAQEMSATLNDCLSKDWHCGYIEQKI